MYLKQAGVCVLFVTCIGLSGCVWLTMLSNQWSENVALAAYGTEANHPALNDGKLDTIAAVPAKNERVFTLKFQDVKPVRKIIIHNGNLFRFDVDYLDAKTSDWKTVHSVRQRRDIENERAQSEYLIDRLNFRTSMLRINVSRTVDDDVVAKPIREPGDKVLDRQLTIDGIYLPHYRVVRPAQAHIREIEVYHLAKNQ